VVLIQLVVWLKKIRPTANISSLQHLPSSLAVALAALIGLNTCLAIQKTLYEGMRDSKYRPSVLLKGVLQWNTYGDLPNPDLLRRYGHVDLLPLREGNLGDVVEVRADLVVAAISQQNPTFSPRVLRG
jgi:hypothetical protein